MNGRQPLSVTKQAPEHALLPTGFSGFDETFGGLPDKSLLLLMGGSGTGAEIFAGQLLYNAARKGARVLYVTIEKPPSDVREELRGIGADLEPQERTNPPRWNFLDAFTPRRLARQGTASVFASGNILSALKDELTVRAKDHYSVLDSLSYLVLRYDLADAIDLLEYLVYNSRQHGGIHLAILNPHMHDPRTVHAILHVVDGAFEFIMEEKSQYIERSLQVRKMKRAAHKMAILPFSLTDRGIRFETTKRVV